MSFQKHFRVVLLKDLIIRKRQYILTTIELLSPVLLFLLVFFFRNLVLGMKLGNEAETYAQTPVFALPHSRIRGMKIYYAPFRPTLDNVIRRAAESLRVYKTNVKEFHNETELLKAIDSPNTAVVVFQNITSNELPKQLKYQIRLQNDFNLAIMKPYVLTPGPHEAYGITYETFVELQAAIDKAYLDLKSGGIMPEMSVQQFPYPKYKTYVGNAIHFVSDEILPVVTILGMIIYLAANVSRLVEERVSGLKEFLKMMGVSTQSMWIARWIMTLPMCLIFVVVSTLCMKASESALVEKTAWEILAITMLLHSMYVVFFIFALSSIFRTVKFCNLYSSITWIFLYTLAVYATEHSKTSWYFVPNVLIICFFNVMGLYEVQGKGIQWNNIYMSPTPETSSVLRLWIILLLHYPVLMCITYYFSNVNPGKHGVAKPLLFCFQNEGNIPFFRKKKVNPDESVTEELSADAIVPVDRKYFEESPAGSVGISVQNVTKVYKKLMDKEMKALDNVSLNVLKGEITVLLGHNGAGKTTLMSIITGIYSATQGDVYVNGTNTKKDMDKARESMGLCTQHNLTIPYLTVREHVMFFGMLKGLSRSEALAQSSSLLAKVRLTGKEGALTQQLSGGMKRRLQLACAIAGHADVLILDEPTSGLDVETRRELWDLFLSLREGRTILLTTHFMEEADALGDRVAILMKGSLKCNATSMYLKKMAGIGYRLTLETEGEANDGDITKVIKHDLPSATISSKDPQKLVYNLPTDQTNRFPNLFASLENKQYSLHIKSMGVAVTTLEDVFVNLSSENASYKDALSDMRDETFINVPVSEPSYVKMTGYMLILQQIKAIFIKCYLYSKANPVSSLFGQIICPLLIAFLAVYFTNNQYVTESIKVKVSSRGMSANEFNANQFIVFYSVDKLDEQFLESWMRSYPHLKFIKTDNVTAAILNVGTNNIYEYGKLLMAFEFSPNNVNALYTTNVYHAMPIAVNAMTNALYRKYVENTNEDGIITINYPLESYQNDTSEAAQIRRFRAAKDVKTKLREPKTASGLYYFICLLLLGSIGPISFIVGQSVMERISGGRHTQIMSGVRSFTYWFATWFWNTLTYSLFPVAAVILAYLLDEDDTINRPDVLGTLFVVLMVGGAAMIPFFYLHNFISTTVNSGDFKVVLSTMVFGVIIPGISIIFKVLARTMPIWMQILNICSMAFPPYNFTMALFTTIGIACKNALCDVSFEYSMCSSESLTPDLAMCCNRTSKYYGPNFYFGFNKQSVLFDICLLLINFIFFMILLVLVENGTLSQCCELIWSKFYIRPKPAFNDPDVALENSCVRKYIKHPDRHSEHIGLVHKLHKSYRGMFSSVAKAVKGVSFTLKQGECFGLLGMNGAGKSTLFKMLTGETSITHGQIVINNNDIYKNREKYLWSIGYCPQFSGVCEYLSGREQLMLIARLRGVPPSAINNEVNTMLQRLDLKQIADRQIQKYSGGNARRLSAGSAMLCSSPLILLDEPSCGVDVAARRSLWAIIKHQLAVGSTVLISSHSMDETEYLSDRIGMMVDGELAALGTVRHLKQMRAQGYTVKLKVRSLSPEDEVDSAAVSSCSESTLMRATGLDTLKTKMETSLNCQLKDQHPAALVYHVDQTDMTYSSLFAYMEEMKATHQVLEDYSVSETTLEQVFMSYSQNEKS